MLRENHGPPQGFFLAICTHAYGYGFSWICIVGVRTMPIPHGLDGFIVWAPYLCHSEVISTTWMNGGQDGLDPSKTIKVQL